MSVRARCWLLVGLGSLVVGAPAAHAQLRPKTQDLRPTTDSLFVDLITIGQGSEVWEKFGHNALWFHNSAGTIDVSYNWGTFDFNQPHFIERFLSGDTRYWVVGIPGTYLISAYREYDRTVVLQRLRLTQAQAQRAFDYAQWNAREENKYYRYDYYRDNCSTRVRDLIDYAVDGQLKTALQGRTPWTYRGETLRLVDQVKWTQLGIDAALGEPADRPLTDWQDAFIPMRLRDALRHVTVRLPGDSAPVPLVQSELTAYTSRAFHERETVPSLWLTCLVAGIGIAVAVVLFAWLATGSRDSRLARVIFLVETEAWAVVSGLGGLVLLLAWTSTRHVFWYRNENLLLLNPLSLWLAVLVAVPGRPRARRAAAVLAVLIAMGSALALVLKVFPESQRNVALALLFVPVHFAVAWGLRERLKADDGALARR